MCIYLLFCSRGPDSGAATRFADNARETRRVGARGRLRATPHSLSSARYLHVLRGDSLFRAIIRASPNRANSASYESLRATMLTFVTGLEARWLQDITRLGHEEIYGFVLYTADQEEKRAVTFAYVARGKGSSFEATLKYKQLSDVPFLNSKMIPRFCEKLSLDLSVPAESRRSWRILTSC